MHCGTNRELPEAIGQASAMIERACLIHDGAIPSFSNTILLWRMWYGQSMFNTLLIKDLLDRA
jgi:hypothetical protein